MSGPIIIALIALLVVCVALVAAVRARRGCAGDEIRWTNELPETVVPADVAEAATALVVRRPVVLAHGIFGFERIGIRRFSQHYFRGVVDHLLGAGVKVYAPRLSPLGSVPARAAQLAGFIESLPHDEVTIVAHSMGGLDARYAIAHLGLGDRVAELITIGTPHRGTPVADLAASAPGRLARRLLAAFGLRSDAVEWLTTDRLARFNAEVPDAPGVNYYSVIARATLSRLWRNPVLLCCHLLLRRGGCANDGLVPVSSQRWGETLAEVDAHHWAQVGWSLRFRAPLFYARLLHRLHISS